MAVSEPFFTHEEQTPWEAGPEASVTVDAHGAVTNWSPEAERLLGYRASEMVGRSAARLLVGVAVDDEGLGAAALRIRRKDGRVVT